MSHPPASHAFDKREGFDARLSGAISLQLGMPAPEINPGVGSANHAEQRARIKTGYDRLPLVAASAHVPGIGVDVNLPLSVLR